MPFLSCDYLMPCDNKDLYISTSIKPISMKFGTVVIEGDSYPWKWFSPIMLHDPFLMWSCEVTWQIKNVVSPLLLNLRLPQFEGSWFSVNGSYLPIHINFWLQDHLLNEKWNESSDFYFTRLKLGWEEIQSKTWFNGIMLSMPQSVSALG